jgi:ATP-dependent DNA helicase RecG
MIHPKAKDLLKQLNQAGETLRIEAKRGTDVGKSIKETVCAFANEPALNGGYILLGIVKEGKAHLAQYKVEGILNPDKIKEDISTLCSSGFNITIRPWVTEEIVSGKCIIQIYIPEAIAHNKPVYIKSIGLPKGAYRRIGSSDMRCTDDDLQLLYSMHASQTYDQSFIKEASIEDLDKSAIALYRQLRANISNNAPELMWNDEELLRSLGCVGKDEQSSKLLPTVAGILFFGRASSLRRIFPMLRIDYIRVPGTTWISDPDNRFTTIEIRDSLLMAVQRAEAAIMDDLPKAFHLPEGELQRKDIPLIPVRVIREALVNALMHRSYREQRPLQIIRYANRIEFKNPGYSLIADEKLGEPGSYPRNPKIAAIFHDLNLAETKGSGIRTMIKLMKDSGLTPPAIHSDRVSNNFTSQLLFHHFLGEEDIKWLTQFSSLCLNDAQKKALIFIRETGAIDNTAYRHLNNLDILEASQQLQELKKLGLISQEGKSSATYYIPSSMLLAKIWAAGPKDTSTLLERHQLSKAKDTSIMANKTDSTGTVDNINITKRHQLSKAKDTSSTSHEDQLKQLGIPENLIAQINALGKRAQPKETMNIIQQLCKVKPFTAEELNSILSRRDKKRLVRSILNPMINNNILQYTIPISPKHPKQKYKTIQ